MTTDPCAYGARFSDRYWPGPTLIAAYTMRMHGHGAHDGAAYVPAEQFGVWAARDPIDCQRARLRALAVDVDAIDAAVREDVELATREALAMAVPDPASALEGVFCDGEPEPLGRGAAPWSGFAAGA